MIWLHLLAAWLVINTLLLLPRLIDGHIGHWITLEAALIVGLFALLPARRWSRWLTWIAAAGLLLITLLALADVAARMSLARPLNLYLDYHLIFAVRNLLVGGLGPVWAGLALLGGVVVAAGLVWLLARLLADVRAETNRYAGRLTGLLLVVFSSASFAGDRIQLGRLDPNQLPTGKPAVQLLTDQTRHYLRMMAERERFAAELARSTASHARQPGLLQGLQGHDVILAFIESYGVSALFDPRYAPVIRPRLDEMEQRIADAGLHLVTGTLVAPMQGGQSWLAHGSLLGGLWLENQLRYDLLLTSDRETLIDDFRHAGYRTIAVLPAITLPWPEGQRFGYDRIYAHRDIDYAGPPLNWVTMPDQFVWSYLQHTIRPREGRPLFAELALISSHAPWTPILPVLDWAEIGDGSIFAPWEHAGEAPAELWLDTDRVREHFALSVDYALNALTGYTERYLDDRTLLIALGDHQPAPLITGEDASRAVPVHVISADPAMLEPFLDWGFVPGAVPDYDGDSPGMDVFRDWFVKAFSAPDEALDFAHR